MYELVKIEGRAIISSFDLNLGSEQFDILWNESWNILSFWYSNYYPLNQIYRE